MEFRLPSVIFSAIDDSVSYFHRVIVPVIMHDSEMEICALLKMDDGDRITP